jgi:ABC-type phosphate/phosphonate transport system substrate-binding protein
MKDWTMFASLPMYERNETLAAHDGFWGLLREAMLRRGVDAPPALARDGTALTKDWLRPDLLMSQTCGYPFRTVLRERVTLIGTPDYGVADCPPGYYRSIFVCRADDKRSSFAEFDGAALAYNDEGSQSGYVGPLVHAREKGIRLNPSHRTGTHRLSALAVASGKAEIAAIDAVTWSILQRWEPGLDLVRQLDTTAPTPGLPYITARKELASVLFETVGEAIASLSEPHKGMLLLRGLVWIPAETYFAVPSL